MKKKRFLFILGIFIIIVLGILGWFKYTTPSNQEQVIQDQSAPTSIRHDNSGAGTTDTGENPIQDHMQHALQHLGL